ncbi:putative membrane protein [Bacteroides uniformis str. 3978 T3 i]|uniref:YjcZ family sporulation protein n=2 Tax=Bacteroides uniformis TaxID=820 RepID=A0ABC9NHF0_BACUC|nr:hypothetical protein BACUNI_00335 [Bacteroides uniformis ATCC 8492]KDS52211.1 putative membrane protein [Bacteroides uniformis str. 3978 T3 ii]KDS55303.1 putative membrane protein [Bacteroides uniformis str. 3978 T3 i]KDS62077.1 putative membrane protein [Bacteroides uniformis str. 3978 T3 i]
MSVGCVFLIFIIAFYFICVVSFFDSGCKGNAFCDSLFS